MENVDFDFGDLDVVPCKYDERYLVYSNGMLYNSKYEQFKAPATNGSKSPYLSYGLYPKGKNGAMKKYYLHRLIADHFLPNPDNLRDVHHIDGNPKNNNVSNLQWLSHQENCALKIYPTPDEVVKENPNAFLYPMGGKNKSNDYYVFSYNGKYAPKIRKYIGRDLEKGRQIRDEYFKVHLAVA